MGIEDSRTRLGPVPLPVLQVHASLNCNLSCAHCYSASGPGAVDGIDPENVCRVVSDAAVLGYRALAFSGGEPLAYPGLSEVLQHARSLGLRTSLTTNGTLSTPRRLRAIAGLVDTVAVSIDGPRELHDRIRGSATAFARTSTGLGRLRETGATLGVIHTLTRESMPHLEWLADFAVKSGAGLLQIHPLEMFGRGRTMGGCTADAEVLSRAYIMGFALQQLHGADLNVQIDIAHRDHLRAAPDSIYAADLQPGAQASAAELLGVLVLEADGSLVPVAYGFGRRFRICKSPEQELGTAWASYVETGYRQFRALCRRAWESLSEPGTPTLLNWHDFIVTRSVAA